MDDAAARLARNLKELRARAGLTQAELARRARLTAETIARLERVVRGRSSANVNPSLETLVRIARALEVDVVDLLGPAPAPGVKKDWLGGALDQASPETRDRILRVAEALLSEPRRKP